MLLDRKILGNFSALSENERQGKVLSKKFLKSLLNDDEEIFYLFLTEDEAVKENIDIMHVWGGENIEKVRTRPVINEAYPRTQHMWPVFEHDDKENINPNLNGGGGNGTECCCRSLSMLASYFGAEKCLAMLCDLGCNLKLLSPDDGASAIHCAALGYLHGHIEEDRCSLIMSFLILYGGANSNSKDLHSQNLIKKFQSSENKYDIDTHQNESPKFSDIDIFLDAESKDQNQTDTISDDFRMYHYKIDMCRNKQNHDWLKCEYAHIDEKAKRRDPRIYYYQPVPCPDFRRGTCKRGDACTFAHGVFECWLHPGCYKTKLCKYGEACTRSICFFAHKASELRTASSNYIH